MSFWTVFTDWGNPWKRRAPWRGPCLLSRSGRGGDQGGGRSEASEGCLRPRSAGRLLSGFLRTTVRGRPGKCRFNGRMIMPQGDKDKYTDKQKRKAEHIAEGYEERGVSKKEAESRAWATVNKECGGGNKSGSGRGKKDTPRKFAQGRPQRAARPAPAGRRRRRKAGRPGAATRAEPAFGELRSCAAVRLSEMAFKVRPRERSHAWHKRGAPSEPAGPWARL